MKKEITEFSKYFNGHVDTVTERFLEGKDVAHNKIYIDIKEIDIKEIDIEDINIECY